MHSKYNCITVNFEKTQHGFPHENYIKTSTLKFLCLQEITGKTVSAFKTGHFKQQSLFVAYFQYFCHLFWHFCHPNRHFQSQICLDKLSLKNIIICYGVELNIDNAIVPWGLK